MPQRLVTQVAMSTVSWLTLRQSIDRHVIDYLWACIEQSHGDITAASKVAGIHRSNFYRLCARHGISLDVIADARIAVRLWKPKLQEARP